MLRVKDSVHLMGAAGLDVGDFHRRGGVTFRRARYAYLFSGLKEALPSNSVPLLLRPLSEREFGVTVKLRP